MTNKRAGSVVLCIAALLTCGETVCTQTLTARSSTLTYTYVYGAGGDTHTGGATIPDTTLLSTDSESADFEDSTSGVLPGDQPYSAGVLLDLDQTYSVFGPLGSFRSIFATASTHVAAAETGLGAAVMHSVNPGNEIVLNFTTNQSVRYHLAGTITLPGANFFSFIALQRFNGFNWEYLFNSAFLPGGFGPFDLSGTLIPGEYRIWSDLSLSAGAGEDVSASYTYNLHITHPADMNCDGAVNGLDIQAFETALQNPAAYAAAYPHCDVLNGDMDVDAAVTAADAPLFVESLLD